MSLFCSTKAGKQADNRVAISELESIDRQKLYREIVV